MRPSKKAILLGLLALAIPARAQEKTKTSDAATRATPAEAGSTAKTVVPLKVTVVFNEYEGEKKISSLPYTLFLRSDEHEPYRGSLRMGVRVPIAIGGKDTQIQYQDVGSNLDCRVQYGDDAKYVLDLTLERSSVYPNSTTKTDHPGDTEAGDPSRMNPPVVRTFRASLALVLHDGQTMQSTLATDPLSGHVLKVDVTLNVVK